MGGNWTDACMLLRYLEYNFHNYILRSFLITKNINKEAGIINIFCTGKNFVTVTTSNDSIICNLL